MSFTSILITGANRGIGLEFVRQLLSLSPQPKYIIATSRQSTNEELDKLRATNDSLHILKLDTKNYDEYQHFVSQVGQIVGDHGIDLLINNAGIFLRDDIESVNPQNMLENFEVNTVTPLMITKALLPLLKVSVASRKTAVVNITSKMGSIEDNNSGGHYQYRASKTALNMVTKSLAVDLKPVGINVIALHPGWVQTDMGGKNASITPFTSVENMINTIKNINDLVIGKMLNYDGNVIPY